MLTVLEVPISFWNGLLGGVFILLGILIKSLLDFFTTKYSDRQRWDRDIRESATGLIEDGYKLSEMLISGSINNLLDAQALSHSIAQKAANIALVAPGSVVKMAREYSNVCNYAANALGQSGMSTRHDTALKIFINSVRKSYDLEPV